MKQYQIKYLWAQEVLAKHPGVRLDKVPGTQNPADLGTKYLAGASLKRWLRW